VLEPLSSEQLARNAALVERLRGQLILAPLTRGNSLPFRRLCAEYGAQVTFSEMAFARQVVKNSPKELAMMRRSPAEACYGVQIATNAIGEGVRAGLQAAEAGADFVDLNVGCPIYEATRRGLGAALLRKPRKLAKLVGGGVGRGAVGWGGVCWGCGLAAAEGTSTLCVYPVLTLLLFLLPPQVNGMALQLPVPLTVKVRLGENEKKINVEEVVGLLLEAGAAAVTVHGRWVGGRHSSLMFRDHTNGTAALLPGGNASVVMLLLLLPLINGPARLPCPLQDDAAALLQACRLGHDRRGGGHAQRAFDRQRRCADALRCQAAHGEPRLPGSDGGQVRQAGWVAGWAGLHGLAG
jgi:hypothetical protein